MAEPEPTPERPPTSTASARVDLLGLPRRQLAAELAPLVDRGFRARQIFDALHRRGVGEFAAMTDLSKDLRARLEDRYRIGLPEVVERQGSADGTAKLLLRLQDGATVEAVDIPDRGRHTFCISSQAGCSLACAFCVTGYWGAGRNLSAGEIVGQVLTLRREHSLAEAGFNVVFMGMGEPLLNLDNLAAAFEILSESISHRRITVSTAGVIPGIEAMAGWSTRPNLAVSLHAPDDPRRSALMPINRTYPLADLLAALERYPLERGRKLTFEYILIREVNDSAADAAALASRLRRLRDKAKVNLIPINPDPVLGEDLVPPPEARVDAFARVLAERGWVVTVRRRRGGEVGAACGQLRAFGRTPRGWRGSRGTEGRAPVRRDPAR